MDAVMYLKEKTRMTEKCKIGCENCPISSENNGFEISCIKFESVHPEKAIGIVKKWSNEHPRKTYLTDFLEKHPNAKMHKYDTEYPIVCVMDVGYIKKCPSSFGNYCECKECWNTLMED